MKIAYIGTYVPRMCGIATFTQNLFYAMMPTMGTSDLKNPVNKNRVEGFVVALDDPEQTYAYPPEVKMSIRQEHLRDYLKAAKFINYSGADICVLEHEFGIFGGQNGLYILSLLHRLEIPLLVTLHTIVKQPSYNEKAVLQQICKMANKVVVMSEKAIEFLTRIYGVNRDKIAFIEHGVPEIQFHQAQAKREFKFEKKKLILTFGILSRNKGIETVIKALPKVVKRYPDVLYLVLGKTHPNVLRHSGEEYRNYLQLLVKSLQLNNHVSFINEFIHQEELSKYLSATDVYITPYLNEAQITSGTLSYAIGAGAAVVSTPYWHATELLAEGRGRLFPFNDSEKLAEILLELFDKPQVLKDLRTKAYEYGKTLTWPKLGKRYVNTVREILSSEPLITKKKKEGSIDPLLLPPFSLDHLKRLTDDTGIIQHAKFGIPNLKEGYCLDDNARALIAVLMTYWQKKDKSALALAPVYLSYIHYMQNKDGTFRNFLSFNRNFLDEVGSEDSFGRTIWALGYLMHKAPNDAYYQTARLLFFEAVPNFLAIRSIRGIANTMIGLSYYLRSNPFDEELTETLRDLAWKLMHAYRENSSTEWHWFESLLAYDNGMLPLALLHASEHLNDETIQETALKTTEFLTEKTLNDGYLSIIGNENWYEKEGQRSHFAQQPVDALAMVLMYHQAYRITHKRVYLNKLFTSFMWFLGENDLRMSLFDFETQGCCDGFERHGVNRNQGAESTLAYIISHLTVLQAFEEDEQHKPAYKKETGITTY
ncbi:MAG: glycosyltransferase family 4 protein [Bacteroidales bacterium]